MFTIQTKILFGIIVILLLSLAVSVTGVYYLKHKLESVQTELAEEKAALRTCEAEHKVFVDGVQEAGAKAIAAAEKQVAKNNQDVKDITDGYLKAKRIADSRIASRVRYAEQTSRSTSSSTMPTETEATPRVDDASEDSLPTTERIIADCREDALRLVWLQAFETKQGESP